MKTLKKYISYLLILSIGIVFGIIFFYLISKVDKLALATEIKRYIVLISKSKISFTTVCNSFFKYFIYFFLIWISGFIFIFYPVPYFITFYKGFILGFLSVLLIFIYKLKGILYFLIFIFPTELLNIIIITAFSRLINLFSKKFYQIIVKNQNFNLHSIAKKYFLLFIVIILISIILCVLELTLGYYLIKTFI